MVAPLALIVFVLCGGWVSSSIGSYVLLDLPRVQTECIGYYDDEEDLIIIHDPNAILGGTFKLVEYVRQQADPTYVTTLYDVCKVGGANEG